MPVFHAGQKTYISKAQCLTPVSANVGHLFSPMPGSENLHFQDFCFSLPSGNFQKSSVYAVEVVLPRVDAGILEEGESYLGLNAYFTPLGPTSGSNDISTSTPIDDFQYIKLLYLPKVEAGSGVVYQVIFFKHPVSGASTLSLVTDMETLPPSSLGYENKVVKVNNIFYFGNPSGAWNTLTHGNYSLAMVSAPWQTSANQTSQNYERFRFIVQPIDSIFKSLCFMINRKALDYNFRITNTLMGRTIDIADPHFSFSIYTLNNLLTENGNIESIAIQGHPELMCGINGAEVKVGRSELYEFRNFPITSFGVWAENSNDYFIVDYTWSESGVNP